MNLWRNDWEKFVEEVARCYSDGLRDNQLAAHFTGNKISWAGDVRSIELGQEFTNGIAMDMPEVKIRLVDNNLIVANYIFLTVDPAKKSNWDKIPSGQSIAFNADLRKARPSYSEIEVSICSKDPELILRLGIENVQVI